MRILQELLVRFKLVTGSPSSAVQVKQTQSSQKNRVDESSCTQGDVLQKALWNALKNHQVEQVAAVMKQILEEVSGHRFKSWPSKGFKEEMVRVVEALQRKTAESITFYAPDDGLSRVVIKLSATLDQQSSVKLHLSPQSTGEAHRRWDKFGYNTL